MDIGQSFGSEACLYTEKRAAIDAVVGFLGVYISPHWVWKTTVLCLSYVSL